MSLPPAYQVRLAAYDLTDNRDALRREAWALLGPNIERIATEYLDAAAAYAPATADSNRRLRSQHAESITVGTRRLFVEPFDAAWIEATEARIKGQIDRGVDVRSRQSLARHLIAAFMRLAHQHYRFRPAKRAELCEVVVNVLMMDVANAIAYYWDAEVTKAKAYGENLKKALDDFGGTVTGMRGAVGEASAAMTGNSDHLTVLSSETAQEAQRATTAASETAHAVSTMAAATEELSISFHEVHAQAERSANMAREAVEGVGETQSTIQSLAEAVQKVGSFVDMIATIAAQTNLLALNATIEAARAGEAGKGFAVVAQEVKLLATQTAKATADIGAQCAAITEGTQDSLNRVREIGERISAMAAIAGSVSVAVEQQRSATNSIVGGVNVGMRNAQTVAEALERVEKSIHRARDTADSARNFAGNLGRRTGELDNAIDALFENAKKQTPAFEPLRVLK
jgi:methyl-accepting chemotaxis protein